MNYSIVYLSITLALIAAAKKIPANHLSGQAERNKKSECQNYFLKPEGRVAHCVKM